MTAKTEAGAVIFDEDDPRERMPELFEIPEKARALREAITARESAVKIKREAMEVDLIAISLLQVRLEELIEYLIENAAKRSGAEE